MEIPNWLIDPIIDVSEQWILAEEVMTLQSDFELKSKFIISYQLFWLQSEIKVKHPHVSDLVKFFSLHFPAHI